MSEKPPQEDSSAGSPNKIRTQSSLQSNWDTAAAALQIDTSQLEIAILAVRHAIKLDVECESPAAGRRWEILGILQSRSRQHDAAVRSLETASLLCPLSSHGQLVLADEYVRAGHVESARAIYQYLATLIPLEIELLEPLAAGLGRVGERELALTICREAADRMPGEAAPLLGIVYYLRRLRRPAATVLPYLTRAFELDPSDTECRISLAWILHSCGRSDDGARLLDEISLSEVDCVRSLTLMRCVYEAVQDDHCATVCKYRLEALAAQKWQDRL